MFNSHLKEEICDLKKTIAELELAIRTERYERSNDKDLIRAKLELEHHKLRDELRKKTYEAEARADAAEAIAEKAEAHAAELVSMARECAADSGIFAGELTEKLLELAAELKPEKPEVKVITVEGANVEVNNDL